MKKIVLKFVFKLVDGMSLTTLRVGTERLAKDEIDAFRKPEDLNTIDGKMLLNILTYHVRVTIRGVSTHPNTKGTFSFAVDKKDVFEKDQDLNADANGRILYDDDINLAATGEE